jgi:hypothetical protein
VLVGAWTAGREGETEKDGQRADVQWRLRY